MVVPTETLKFTFETVFTLVLVKARVTSERCSVFRFATALDEETRVDEAEDDVLDEDSAVPPCRVFEPCPAAEPC